MTKKDKTIFRFLQVKQEVMEEKSKEVTDEVSGEVRTETELVGTGKYEVCRYLENDKDKFEAKCIELLNTYNRNEIVPIALEDYDVDLLWKSE